MDHLTASSSKVNDETLTVRSGEPVLELLNLEEQQLEALLYGMEILFAEARLPERESHG